MVVPKIDVLIAGLCQFCKVSNGDWRVAVADVRIGGGSDRAKYSI